MQDNNIKLDVIKLLKEVKLQGIKNLEIKYGDFELKIKDNNSIQSMNTEIPEASKEQVDDMENMERRTIEERIKERDESLLDEIDFIAPELAGDLRRSNIIKVGSNNCYEYVEGETLSG